MKLTSLLIAFFVTLNVALAADNGQSVTVPDFTQGDAIPKQARHDWNLGASGARGWIFCDRLVTTDARQIAITQVEAGSSADGVLAAGDVLLGVGGQAFSYDPRTEIGKALNVAESEAGGGKLTLTRWRAGKTEEVIVTLPVLGSYSATAPFDCPKSKRILEQGCAALAARMSDPNYTKGPNREPITRSLNALALLASGDSTYLPLIKREAQWAANFSDNSMQTWRYGYVTMLLSEYVLATGDDSVLPGLKRLALEAAQGQSAVGSWGHGFARPDGRLGGYGMMNSPGLPLTISLVMAREAGVKDAAVDRAIERSARLLRFYIGKGAIPYGDHHPWIETHEDNGKCGMAAVLFGLLNEPAGAEFFSRMSVASHGSERDTGHTGNFFNILWAMPGLAPSGPQATGAWMREFGGWYFDLARQADGTFPHQGPPEPDHDRYAGWDCTGCYLLAYALPLRKILLTGKQPGIVPQLDAAAARALVSDGRGWSNRDRHSAYDQLSEDQLIERLGSWSPIVRERAALALGRRQEAPVSRLIELLGSPQLTARYGACQALIVLRGRGAAAVDPLRASLQAEDLWLRIKAAEALAAIGAPAMKCVPELLELLTQVDAENDPRGMQQRYVTFALFERRGGLLSRSLAGVDREALYQAVRAGLKNQDGRARGSISSVYRNLSLEEIRPLLPAIHQAILEPAPSGEMFADEIRVEGARLLAQHRIEEGINACGKYCRDQNPWGSQNRTPELMKILLSYGAHAKTVIPELTRLADYFERDEPNFPANLKKQKANSVRQAIRDIEASTESPELIRIK
ncbi:MAG: acetylesterase [Pirellulaceae bacterium]|nr:acetylesterase [Pirellulaceae bacterium]